MKKRLVALVLILIMLVLTGCNFIKTYNQITYNIKHKMLYHPKFDQKISRASEFRMFKNIVSEGIYLDSNNYINTVCTTNNDISLTKYKPIGPSALIDISNNIIKQCNKWNDRIYPASTTKIMTALLGLELGKMDDVVTVSETIRTLDKSSTIAGLCVGDKIKFSDLLYAMMLPSGNDASIVVSEYIGGSVENFSNLMNQKALELGCTHTHFVNPNGLHDPNHYTTVGDMYLIFNEAIKNNDFRQIIKTSNYKFNVVRQGNNKEIFCQNTNEFITGKTKEVTGVTNLGGKTGTTKEAGCCLIQLVNYKNIEYIEITMGIITDDNKKGHITLYNKSNELLRDGLNIK